MKNVFKTAKNEEAIERLLSMLSRQNREAVEEIEAMLKEGKDSDISAKALLSLLIECIKRANQFDDGTDGNELSVMIAVAIYNKELLGTVKDSLH